MVPTNKYIKLDFNLLKLKEISLYNTFIFLLISSYLIIYFLTAYKFLSYPFEIGYGEGFLMYFSSVISKGQSVYRDISDYPASVPGIYAPVYMYICAFFTKLFGLSFSVGRIVSVVSSLGIGVIIYLILVRSTSKKIAFFSSVIFFTSPINIFLGLLYRVDMMGLFFSLLGIYFVIRYENSKFVLISTLFFLLSIYTKQSYISAPLATFFFLLIRGDKKIAFEFLILFGMSGLLLFGLANLITNGQFYVHTVSHHMATDFSLDLLLDTYIEFLNMSYHYAVLVVLMYVLYLVSKKKISLFVLYFLFSLLGSVSLGKEGSDHIYFMEIIAVCCVLFGYLLKDLKKIFEKETILKFILPALIIYPMFYILIIWDIFDHYNLNEEVGRVISKYVKESEGRILTMDAGFVVLNGKDLLIEPFLNSQLAEKGLWDQSKLLDDLREKRISLVIYLIFLRMK
jgi:hypothetical protein